MNKFIKAFSFIVIALFVLATFGWMSVQLSKGNKDFGILSKPIEFMYSFFDNFEESVEEVKGLPPTFVKTPEGFESINNLKEDVVVVFTYSESDNTRVLATKNLRTDSVLFSIKFPDEVLSYDRINNPLLMPNGDIIYGVDSRTGLRRLSREGDFIWKQDSFRMHHAFNLDSTGNIWTCSRPKSYQATATYSIEGRGAVYFYDEYISQINTKTGEVLFHKSVTEIFKDHKLEDYLLQSPTGEDPIHLNDVQPALKTTERYKEGYLFLSSKSLSMIMHYRPSTNEIINIVRGPFSAQHDVDFYNDTTLTWFNNNYYPHGVHIFNEPSIEPTDVSSFVFLPHVMTNIITYNLNSGKMTVMDKQTFDEHKIFTMTEGLHEHINDSTYFVEQQNIGYIWVIQNGKVIYKNVFPSQHEGYHHLPNWTRIIRN